MASVAAVSGFSFASVHFNWNIVNWILSWHWQSWLTFWFGVMIAVIFKGTVDAIHRCEVLIAAADQHQRALEENVRQLSDSIEAEKRSTQALQAELANIQSSFTHLQEEKQKLETKLPSIPK